MQLLLKAGHSHSAESRRATGEEVERQLNRGEEGNGRGRNLTSSRRQDVKTNACRRPTNADKQITKL